MLISGACPKWQRKGARKSRDQLVFKDLVIDFKGIAGFRGEDVPLSAKEFEVLKFFVLNANKVLTREEIYDYVWGYQEYGDITP